MSPPLLAEQIQSESSVLRAVLRYLELHPKVSSVIRINSGGAYVGDDQQQRFVRFNEISGQAKLRHAAKRSPNLAEACEELVEVVPDIIGLMKDGRFLAVEVKRSNWRKPSTNRERSQERFINRVKSSGAIGGFVTSLRDAERLLSDA